MRDPGCIWLAWVLSLTIAGVAVLAYAATR